MRDIAVPIDPTAATVEVWIVNSHLRPISSGSRAHHFQKTYDLFKSSTNPLPKKSIPTYFANSTGLCSDPPGLKPVKCPGLVF